MKLIRSPAPIKALLVIFGFALSFLSGCVAVPVVAVANAYRNSGIETIVLTGPAFNPVVFREAVAENMGRFVYATKDFAMAEFPLTGVKVDFYDDGNGVFRLAGSNNSNSRRILELEDSISVTTTSLANSLVKRGYVTTGNRRDR